MALEERVSNLYFSDYGNPTAFVNQFNKIVTEFKELGIEFDND